MFRAINVCLGACVGGGPIPQLQLLEFQLSHFSFYQLVVLMVLVFYK